MPINAAIHFYWKLYINDHVPMLIIAWEEFSLTLNHFLCTVLIEMVPASSTVISSNHLFARYVCNWRGRGDGGVGFWQEPVGFFARYTLFRIGTSAPQVTFILCPYNILRRKAICLKLISEVYPLFRHQDSIYKVHVNMKKRNFIWLKSWPNLYTAVHCLTVGCSRTRIM